jgi:Flp pilus assembly pilin Flp
MMNARFGPAEHSESHRESQRCAMMWLTVMYMRFFAPTEDADTHTDKDLGATMVEYALMVALIAVVAIGAVTLLGGSVRDIFTSISDKL